MHPYLNNEPGKETIEPLLLTGDACISVVNLAEVISKLCDWGMSCETAREVFDKLALKLEPFTAETTFETARLRTLTKAHGLSLGDRAWLEVAQALDLTISTFRPAAH